MTGQPAVAGVREGGLPLSGIHVLDLTQYVSGPFCTMLLAELGADVIKVEPPTTGDVYRQQGPSFLGGVSTSFLSMNRSKRSLTLDLKRDEAREVIRRLADRVDAVVENFKPATAERLGVGYETLRAVNPELVYCSISGYGQTGPNAGLGGYDLMAQARGGIMAVTGPGEETPTKVGVPIVDLGTGVYAALAITASLLSRERGNGGRRIDLGLLDTAVSFLPMLLTEYQATGVLPKPLGNASPFFAPYEVFRTKDGFITLVGTGGKVHWESLCQMLGLPDLPDDPRFASNSDRVVRRAELHEILEAVLVTETSEHWIGGLRAAGLPCDPLQNLDAVLEDPQVQSRAMIGSYLHPQAGKVTFTASPLAVGGARAPSSPPPLLGQHSREILGWLGFSDQEVEGLQAAGVV